MSLCEISAPSQELVDKYDSLKSTFYKRLLHAYGSLQSAAAPLVEKVGQGEGGQNVMNFFEDLQGKPEFQAFVKVARWVPTEINPSVEDPVDVSLLV